MKHSKVPTTFAHKIQTYNLLLYGTSHNTCVPWRDPLLA